MATLSLSLLGPCQAALDGRPLTKFRTNKTQALLIYLAVEARNSHRRDALMALLFPDLPQKSAQTNLRQIIYQLRQSIPELTAKDGPHTEPFLITGRQTVQINTAVTFELDIAVFTNFLRAIEQHEHTEMLACSSCQERLRQAATLYRGNFLADFYLPNSAAFEEWALARRETLRRQALAALAALTQIYARQRDYEKAEDYARQQLEIDSLRESAHRQLMEVLARNGRRRAALSHYETCRQLLNDELSIDPSPETQALYEAIHSGELDGMAKRPSDKEKQKIVPPAPWHNLPSQPTPFIGRETELAALDDLIAQAKARLVTIVGPGGMGKTRLALTVAERQLTQPIPRFPNGLCFVSLAELNAAERMAPALADALNLPLQNDGRSPHQQIRDYLRQKQMLIIMDNFEHLLDGVVLVTDILQAAPDVQILATSRERLHLHEEQVYPIQGLEFPDWETPEDAGEYTAVQLFLQSARRIKPDFELAAGDLTYLTRICRLVAGMPLAIELAAAWVEMLSLADIAAEIGQSLDLLETDLRNVPQRHRSIRAVFDASWERLSQAERDVFPNLSIFRGGFTREAAQKVARASLAVMARLISKSLLQYNQAQDRYQIHELLRQYGAEKLADRTSVTDRHCAYFCNLLKNLEADLKGAGQQAALAQIKADIENVRLAWTQAVSQGHATQLEQAMDSLGCYYWWHGPFMEGETAFGTAAARLAAMLDIQRRLLAKTLTWQAQFKRILRDVETAEQLIQKSLALLDSPALDNEETRPERAFALWVHSGCVPAGLKREATMRQLCRQSLAMYQALGDQWGTAQALWFLAEITDSHDEARQLAEASLEIRQALGDQRGIAFSLWSLAGNAESQGQFEQGERLRRECMAIFQETGDRPNFALGHLSLGLSLARQGGFVKAHELVEQCATLLDELGMRSDYTFTLMRLGNVKAHLGRYNQADDLAQTILTLSRETGIQWHKGFSQRLLGEVALAKTEYARARKFLEKTIPIFQIAGHKENLAYTMALSAFATYGLKQHAQAGQYIAEAMQTAVKTRSFRLFLYTLAATALLRADQGEKERAVELYGLAARHRFVANSRWFADVVGGQMTAVIATLPLEVANAAQARGQKLDLWETAAELLVGLSKTTEEKGDGNKVATSSPHSLTLPQPEQRFIPKSLLAVGSHGTVYLGQDTVTRQKVVIKQLKPELVAQQPEFVARFIREGEALRQLNHPNIVKMFAIAERDGEHIIVMEYVPGGDLRDLLEREGQLPLARVLNIGLELADALTRAHHLGIIHRDLKPANILLAEDGAPRLTDFGIAHLSRRETRLTQAGSFMGSPAYISPEACQGEELDARSDVWSFGVLLYEMLAGRPPFVHEQIAATLVAILNDPAPDLTQFRPEAPPALVTLIHSMLAKEREGRIGSVRKVAAELEAIRNSLAAQK